jgi:hypothetical protein
MTDNEKRGTPPGGLPDEFLQALGARFGFDALEPALRRELDDIARRYRRDVIAFDNAETRATRCRDYQNLRKAIGHLRQTLAAPAYEALADDITLTLLLRPAGPPQEETGEAVLERLDGLLALVSGTADTMQAQFAPPKGRPRDHALESLVRRLGFVWAGILGLPFSLDYHQGSALTEAGQFVLACVARIDPAVSQTRVITAMRTIIAERNRKPPTGA